MSNRLHGRRVAIFAEDLFEDSELLDPMHFLRAEGAEVVIVGPGRTNQFRGKQGSLIEADVDAAAVDVAAFDAFIVPGGYAPGKMRNSDAMIELIARADDLGKVVAAICHGPQLLISADILRGRMATCVRNIAVDVKNAGASYFDDAVVVDGNLITSRTPADLPDFLEAIADALVSTDPKARQHMVAGA
jgi:protease I